MLQAAVCPQLMLLVSWGTSAQAAHFRPSPPLTVARPRLSFLVCGMGLLMLSQVFPQCLQSAAPVAWRPDQW